MKARVSFGLVFGLLFGFFVAANSNAATISAPIIKGNGVTTVYMVNEVIATSSYIEKTFYNIGGYANVDFKISAQTTGTITTANVSWVIPSGASLVQVNSATLTAGTPITAFKSDVCTIRIYSNLAQTDRVTGNILFRGAF